MHTIGNDCLVKHCFRVFSLFIFFDIFFMAFGFCQQSIPNTIHATYIKSKIKFDGSLTDSVWQTASRISNFTQRELDFGKTATQNTETAILYDKTNLYIGVWCYQNPANAVTSKYLQRDFD